MTELVERRSDIWDEFLNRWPLENLLGMALVDYSQAGNKDCFVYWLESKTEALGSIWGGSAFKFGVFSRKDQEAKPDARGVRYGPDYAWAVKYGDSSDAAFSKVRSIVSEIAVAARNGDLAAIENADLGDVTKWKIAFLYQNRSNPTVLPIYKRESLQAIFDSNKKATCAEMHGDFMTKLGSADLLTYGDQLLGRIKVIEEAKLSTSDALTYLQSSESFKPIKTPTDKMAGFRSDEGRELALVLGNRIPTLFLSPGPWLEPLQPQFGMVRLYSADKPRNSNLGANAPGLAAGSPAVSVTVPNRATLDALCEAYLNDDLAGFVPPLIEREPLLPMRKPPLNQILYGPPGTGKTFATIDAALEILDPAFLNLHRADANNRHTRKLLKDRFDALDKEKRIRFVTFHQSFSYEDFVEGIRASTEAREGSAGSSISYKVEKGVFAELCRDARRDRKLDEKLGVKEGARVWKISIEGGVNTVGDTRRYCLSHNEARIGWPKPGDLRAANLDEPAFNLGEKDKASLTNFSQEIETGDVVVCLASRATICAVGVVTGEYEYTEKVPIGVRPDYVHRLPVHWLATNLAFDIVALNQGVRLTLQTVYPMSRITWPDLELALKASGINLTGGEKPVAKPSEPYVLVIDEINRGNVSRIFGELITLIESSKREGEDEALEVVLPYSRDSFSVPNNVYLVGTMNTADRSLAGLDIALRRRFVFREMPPRPELLDDIEFDGIDIGELLRVMNQRIEALLDRDHRLGHAYFIPLKEDRTLVRLGEIFRNQVLPLLQEYFFEDWQRIQWVLNDHRKPVAAWRFVQSQTLNAPKLFGEGVTVSQTRQTWLINEQAFGLAESYRSMLDQDPDE